MNGYKFMDKWESFMSEETFSYQYVLKFIKDWNKQFKTKYKSIKSFNDGEKHLAFKKIK